jgi:hypothetical protein
LQRDEEPKHEEKMKNAFEEPSEPPNYRPSIPDKRGIRYRRQCSNCKYIRVFPLTYSCIRHLAYVRSNHVCDDWQDGRNKWGFARMEPTEAEVEVMRRGSPLLNLQNRVTGRRKITDNSPSAPIKLQCHDPTAVGTEE